MSNLFNQQFGKFGLSAGVGDNGRIQIFDSGEFTGRQGVHGITDEAAFRSRFGNITDRARRSRTSLPNLSFNRIIQGAQSQFESKQAMALADQQAREFNQRLAGASPGDTVALPGGTAFTIDPSGAPRTAQGMQRLQQVGQGDVVEIEPGKFVPTGSAAAQFPQGVAGSLAQQAATPTNTDSPFVNVMGAFFEQTPEGLKTITDPQTLTGLATGAIASTTRQSNIGQPVGILPEDVSSARTGFNIPVDSVSTDNLGSSATRADVLRTAGGMQNFLDELRNIQKQEIAAREAVSNLQISGLQGLASVRDQAIPMPLIGQQAALLEQQIAMQALPLEQRLETLALQRGNVQETINLALQLQQMTRPDVLSTQVNKSTGDLLAVVQDPQTGAIKTQVVGNVGAAEADYIAQSIGFDHSRGQDVFRGVNADGTVDIVPLGTSSQAPKAVSSGGGFVPQGGGELTGNAQAVFNNPSLWNQLTPSEKGKLMGELSQAGFSFPNKLDDEARANVESGFQATARMRELLIDDDGGINRSELARGVTGLGSFAFNRRESVDVVSRIRTGAALTASEEDFYKRQSPGVWDTADTIKEKLNHLTVFYGGLSGQPVTLAAPDGNVYVYEDMFNPKVRQEVREAISNGYQVVQ